MLALESHALLNELARAIAEVAKVGSVLLIDGQGRPRGHFGEPMDPAHPSTSRRDVAGGQLVFGQPPQPGSGGALDVLIRAFERQLSNELERRRLQESEERLSQALFAVDDGLFDWRLQEGRIDGNDRLFTMLGYAPGSLRTIADWRALTHPDDLPAAEKAIWRHLRGTTDHYRAELRIRAADGSYTWILDRGRVAERDVNGRALRMTGLHSDISERKRLEAALLTSEKMSALGLLSGRWPTR